MTSPDPLTRPYFSVHEVAVLLSVSQKHVLRLCEEGVLSPTGVRSGLRIIPVTTVESYLHDLLERLPDLDD